MMYSTFIQIFNHLVITFHVMETLVIHNLLTYLLTSYENIKAKNIACQFSSATGDFLFF